MTPIVSLLVGVVVVFAITAFTAYFVAQEFAYMAVDRSRLQSRAASGDTVAQRTLDITRRTSFMLSGAQLGITVTGLLVGYVAEPLIGQAFGSLVTGGQATALSVTIGGVIALLFSTFVQMLFGELFPKNYAIARPDETAGWLSASTKVYLTVFGPLIWVFDKTAELLLRLLGVEPVHDVENAASATDLERVVDRSRASGTLPPDLSLVIDRIIDFPRRDVRHAMVPRVRVGVVRDTASVAQVRADMAVGHTRYPVLDEDEGIVGVAHLRDVLGRGADDQSPVTELAREALVLPEFMTLPDALDQLRGVGEELACVVDEFGSFVGIITVEDLAEEIVGEVTDEHDPEAPDYVPQPDDGVWVMAGDVHVDEVERAIMVDLPRGDYETIAGLAIQTAGNLPDEGDVIDIVIEPDAARLALDPYAAAQVVRVEVLDVAQHVPARVRVTLPDPDAPAETVAEASGSDADVDGEVAR